MVRQRTPPMGDEGKTKQKQDSLHSLSLLRLCGKQKYQEARAEKVSKIKSTEIGQWSICSVLKIILGTFPDKVQLQMVTDKCKYKIVTKVTQLLLWGGPGGGTGN